MICPTRGGDNREGAKFCNNCGAPLPLRCPGCGTENRPGAKFCDDCGTALSRVAPAGGEHLSAVPSSAQGDCHAECGLHRGGRWRTPTSGHAGVGWGDDPHTSHGAPL
jgi:hypothetical protein